MIAEILDLYAYATAPASLRRQAGHICRREKTKAILGTPRLRPATLGRIDYERLTCAKLDALLRERQIAGRSKARRKAQKVELLMLVPNA
jgi:hypothetical protein